MSRLLCFFSLLLTSFVCASAQVGNDPQLVDPTGSPVMVPSKSRIHYNSNRYQRVEPSKYEIPGTLRDAGRNAMGERTSPQSAFEYTPAVPPRDTTSVFVMDEEGRPIREVNDVYEGDRENSGGDRVISVFPQNGPEDEGN